MSSRQAHQGIAASSAAQECREGTEGRSYRLLPANRVFPGPSAGVNMRRTARVSIEERRGASLVKMLQCQRHPMIWQTSSRCRYAAPVNLLRRGPTAHAWVRTQENIVGITAEEALHHPCSDVRPHRLHATAAGSASAGAVGASQPPTGR
jgi:hypothetical protein